ncbi:MAG: hypothetical protein PHP30_07220 [Bacteroidales bacterium]|nr:hypothetical protein [Bacteroidales bacterium]MDD2424687.1 hypothetical protein [Bacteroidales bacterium]MDD3989865.1 hypothetical protein [Bacteroidales bacterium]MDD4638443.1 hypothetical protein [Bacteroidales bacterium]
MKISKICELVNGSIVCGESKKDEEVEYAFASDLMSDVLTVRSGNFILITGLANVQSVRTAEMSDVSFMLVCRDKEVTPAMIEVADESNILIVRSPFSMFRCSGILFKEGLKPVF